MQHHTRCGSSAGLTVKRDEVTEFTPTGDLGLTDKSSFLFNSLLFGPKRDKKQHQHHDCAGIKTRTSAPGICMEAQRDRMFPGNKHVFDCKGKLKESLFIGIKPKH